MNAWNLRVLLDHSLNDYEERHYLSMSAIGKCARYLYSNLVYGRKLPSLKSARYFHEGYLHERDVIERLDGTGMIRVVQRGRELVAPFDKRFCGHIDGEVDSDLLEIKSVDDGRFERVIEKGAIQEHVDQVQMYMRYGGYSRAFLVYKCRSTGEVLVKEIARDDQRGVLLEEKARAILAAVDRGLLPECTCGFCH